MWLTQEVQQPQVGDFSTVDTGSAACAGPTAASAAGQHLGRFPFGGRS
jgi:hypothetical protein